MLKDQFAILGIDIGTTHCKAGLFIQEGSHLRVAGLASRPTHSQRSEEGYAYYDPRELWETVSAIIQETIDQAPGCSIAAVGVASMAETGLLVDRSTGEVRSALLPWFDTTASHQAERMAPAANAALRLERFTKSGIYPSFKCSLAKILWLRDQDKQVVENAIWLSAADYIVYRLTGEFGTDYSLAGRTYAFDICAKNWDEDWLGRFGLSSSLFPKASISGTPVGTVKEDGLAGLSKGIPVSVAGHDHVCAAFAFGAAEPGKVFDSMGTAETLMAAIYERRLGEAEFGAGLSFGHHVVSGRFYWMGGLSSSGGSIEWLRSILGEPPLSYAETEGLLAAAPPGPTGIVYLPYLSGSGSPHNDPRVRAALVGVSATHTRADLVKAFFEGTAFELEVIRRGARAVTGDVINRVVASGGGTRNYLWMQVKADVFGVPIEVPDLCEATVLGAALSAAVGSGVYTNEAEALATRPTGGVTLYKPNPVSHAHYQDIYENGFLPLQDPLRRYSRWYSKNQD